MTMRVLFDYQAFNMQKAGGVSRYFVELADHLRRLDGIQIKVLAGLYVNEHLRARRAELADVVTGMPLHRGVPVNPGLSLINRAFLSAAIGFFPSDIYHATYFNRLLARSRMKRVVTVFDMTYERYPHLFLSRDPTPRRKKRSVEEADGVICISENTRNDLVELYRIPAEKTCVIYPSSTLAEVPPAESNVEEPFFLFVGHRAAYKNFGNLLAAMARMQGNERDCRLLCFGGPPPAKDELAQIDRLQLRERVRFMKGPDDVLAGLYRKAVALVYPSLYEGFGLPLVEAMALRCPVLSSDRSSLPEVAKDAALFFNPEQAEDMAEKMTCILHDTKTRDQRVEKGLLRARIFTWENCARETLSFYRRIAES